MNYAELIEKLLALPEEKQAEVFDFVDYLAQRFGVSVTGKHGEWSEQEFLCMSLSQALRGMEDEEWSYDEGDLKERWQ